MQIKTEIAYIEAEKNKVFITKVLKSMDGRVIGYEVLEHTTASQILYREAEAKKNSNDYKATYKVE